MGTVYYTLFRVNGALLDAARSARMLESRKQGVMSSAQVPRRDGHGLPEGVHHGATLAGKYRLGAVLGSGAMGVVVEARHLVLNQRVAIKFLVSERIDRPDAVHRFVQEARAAVQIQSEHVVRVLDVAVMDGGPPYIVMERLDGRDLATWLREEGPLPLGQAVDFVLQACEAIAESHRLGIIHRDLKPANLFAVDRADGPPLIKVLDFGISKTTRLVPITLDVEGGTLESAHVTQAQTILGSPFHMSPEQMEATTDVDGRTDIWAFGVTLFELLTGRPPFTGSSLVQVYSRMAARDSSVWRAQLGAFPAEFVAIVARCLEWDRSSRYATVVDLARDLALFGSSQASVSLASVVRIANRPDLSESNPGLVKALGAAPARAPVLPPVVRSLAGAVIAGFVGSAIFVQASRSQPFLGARTASPPAAESAVRPAIAERAAPSSAPAEPAEPIEAVAPAIERGHAPATGATALPRSDDWPSPPPRSPAPVGGPKPVGVPARAPVQSMAAFGSPVPSGAAASSMQAGGDAPAPAASAAFDPARVRSMLQERE